MANYVPYSLPGGKVKRIPMNEINKLMNILHLSKDEAIKVYLEDEGELINQEQEALEAKARDNRITATIHQAKADKPVHEQKTQRERVKKPDAPKERIIAHCAELLNQLGVENVEIANPSKLINFTIDGVNFSLDMVRHGNKKKKKKGT